jgi:hypothetical protein
MEMYVAFIYRLGRGRYDVRYLWATGDDATE